MNAFELRVKLVSIILSWQLQELSGKNNLELIFKF
jgi:hypothetical protein